MQLEDIRAIISAPDYRVVNGSIVDLVDPEELLAGQTKDKGYVFALILLSNGKCAALWESHAVIADTVETLLNGTEDVDGVLNNHERTLVTYGVT